MQFKHPGTGTIYSNYEAGNWSWGESQVPSWMVASAASGGWGYNVGNIVMGVPNPFGEPAIVMVTYPGFARGRLRRQPQWIVQQPHHSWCEVLLGQRTIDRWPRRQGLSTANPALLDALGQRRQQRPTHRSRVLPEQRRRAANGGHERRRRLDPLPL